MLGTTCFRAVVLVTLASAALAQDDAQPPATRSRSASHALAAGGPAVCIFNNIPGHPKAAVPGMPGVSFDPGTGTTHFDRPFGSPNGNWVLTALTDIATIADDEVLLVNGVVELQEGTGTAAYPGELTGTLDTRVGINDAGDWAYTTNTSGPTTADDYVVQVVGGVFTAAAKEGGAVPAIPGATYDDVLETVVLTSSSIGFSADLVDGGGVTTADDDWIELGSVILAREGLTVPAGQLGTDAWENFNLNDYFVTHDGAHWLVQGDLLGLTTQDQVVAYDGPVVLQENVIIPGSGFANPIDAAGIVGCFLDHGGNWYARGNNDIDELDWVVRNGAVVAMRGGPIFTGSLELWDDATFADLFFLHCGDSNGNYVIGGVTSAAVDVNGVLVLNNTKVLIREGDPVDLDGNGLFDEDAFFSTFGNDDGVLTDAGVFYFTATIRNAALTTTGQGFFAIANVLGPQSYCVAKVNSCGSLPTIAGTGTPSASDPAGFAVSLTNARGSDGFNLKQGVLIYSVTGPGSTPFMGGTLCLSTGGPIKRTITQIPAFPGTAGMCDAIHMIDMNAFTQGLIPGQGVPDAALSNPLQQVWCQWIARDTAANGTLLSDALTYVQGP